MLRVTFVLPNGAERIVEAAAGASAMQAAVANDVPGILAECGGACACATCHVVVLRGDPGVPSETEAEMLDFAASPREPGSRLSCQIALTDALDGLVLRVPDTQV